MKKKRKKSLLSRRSWTINPVTRVKKSAKTYARPRQKRDSRHEKD